ncbi:MAG: CoA transferase [Dermatophilaceae bacterium]|nr:CoA transferase [Intrasporangiaceae bacterium]
MTITPVDPPLDELLRVLGLDERYASAHLLVQPGNGLPSNLGVNALACGSVAAAALSGLALQGGSHVVVDPRQVSVSFRGDQLLSVDGRQFTPFAALSGFFATQDGWVRTHANYPHHEARLLGSLGLPADADRRDLAETLSGMHAQAVEDTVTEAGGVVARVRTAEEWRASEQGQAVDALPLLARDLIEDSPPLEAPYRPKVLDLTRVIAGPVATQALGYVGADVLRIDSPHLIEPDDMYALSSAEKRSTLLDLDSHDDRETFEELLGTADVVVTGYRPGALDAYGLSSEELAERHPHLVHATLSAWGTEGPWRDRRGFDSIVQAATGIAMAESPDGEHPGALPAQALDQATGYLLAAGVFAALRARSLSGGIWRVSAHLARTAHWLLDAEPDTEPGQLVPAPETYQTVVRGDVGLLLASNPAFSIGERDTFSRMGGRWGADEPRWADDPR